VSTASSVQQAQHALDVSALERVDEPPDDLALARRARERRPRACVGGQPGLERPPRPLQGAVDRRLRGTQHRRDLDRSKAHHVAQHEHRALARRQVLQRRHERQAHGLAGLVARLGSGRPIGHAVQERVRVRLQPHRLDAATRLGQLARGVPWRRPRPPRRRAQRVQAPIRRDPVQPRAQRGSRLVAIQAAPRGEQGLLHQVLGVLHRPDDPVAVQLQLAPVGIGQLPERVLVPSASARERSVRQHGHQQS
jgi:hypothetical protein